MKEQIDSITFEYISNENDFLTLKETWNYLLQNSLSDNIYLTWEYLYTWWQTFQEGKELLIIIMKENNNIIGIAPLYRTKLIFFGIRPLWHLELLGSTGTSSEYLDLIFLKGKEKILINVLLDTLFNNQRFKWDVLNLIAVNEESYNFRLLKTYIEASKIKYWLYEIRTSPFIKLPVSFEGYLQTLNSDTRSTFRHQKNRLFKNQDILFEVLNKESDLEKSFDDFVELHQKRQVTKNEAGSFTNTRKNYLLFHKRLIKVFFKKNWLYLVFLKCNNQPVAAQYDFIYNGKIFNHSVGFNPEWSKKTPGNVLILKILEDAIERKVKEYDFLRGDERYKYHWTKTDRKTYDIAIWRTKKGYCFFRIERFLRKAIRLFVPSLVVKKIYVKLFTRS